MQGLFFDSKMISHPIDFGERQEWSRLESEFFQYYINAKGYRVGNDESDGGQIRINFEPSQN
jgi:hypothetical protein